MAFPVVTVAGNGFLKSSVRFQIKGVAYIGDSSGSSIIDTLADSNADQCAIDAPLIKELGANTISVHYVDPTQGHDKCMQSFQDNEIYVIANMATQRDYSDTDMSGLDPSSNLGNSTWQTSVFNQYAAVLDSMASYENLLGLIVGNEVVDKSTQVDLAPFLKAAVRDMKAYAVARQYRTIPIGYFTSDDDNWAQQMADYLVCGGNTSEAIDFLGFNDYSWCGQSSMNNSDYGQLTSDLEDIGVPLFFSEDGCTSVQPRTFDDQAAIFGSNMSDVWSGAIIYEWRKQSGSESEFGIVSYTTSAPSTPTLLSDYSALSSQWASVTMADNAPSTLPTPSCPASTGSFWPVDPSAALPTIAGLNFANIKPASASSTATSSGAGTSTITSTSTNTGSPNLATSDSGLSTGAKAGIGVGVACGVILVLSVLFWVLYRRRRPNSKLESSSAPISAGPVPELPATKTWRHPPSELPAGEDGQAQELDSVAVHEVGNEAHRPEGEEVKRPSSRDRTVYK
ncbi:uncharacterized protein BHQ10_007252 [Talaromyces amestolkiae]|uniref:1,3-beta-glucanosyltransferase n=1 Tax=Talaromyces amestolkiae TaxID=1196081 RepID=A0A364L5Y7_TALAM|nr:uncharacterized protein BHQ10_007252 [Talaromyces amestolkiae]RAO71240.1 hypothetical protein BHQ10_007252 [Talaromyces amestolkiae]